MRNTIEVNPYSKSYLRKQIPWVSFNGKRREVYTRYRVLTKYQQAQMKSFCAFTGYVCTDIYMKIQ